MRQVRTIRYQEIAEVAARPGASPAIGRPGGCCPSEAELSERVRRQPGDGSPGARAAARVGPDRRPPGFGWFVAASPVRQTLARLGTIEAQMEAEGPAIRAPDPRVRLRAAPTAESVACSAPTRCCGCKRVNLADGEPFAVVTVWCPAELGQHLSRRDVERTPFYELLDLELRGATQTIGADAAVAPRDAELLGVPAGSPVLRCERVTTDDRRPSGAGVASTSSRPTAPSSWSTSPRTPSISPSGLRLSSRPHTRFGPGWQAAGGESAGATSPALVDADGDRRHDADPAHDREAARAGDEDEAATTARSMTPIDPCMASPSSTPGAGSHPSCSSPETS